MKKILFGIFAHPDDEAFGPSGTLLKMAREGVDIHLICATSGEAGANPDGYDDLGAARLREWRDGGSLIGVSTMECLGYQDGELRNSIYHSIAQAIEDRIGRIITTYNEPLELSFMTFDHNGISGHIDHITMSFVTSYVFYRLKANPPRNVQVKELRYFCIDRKAMPEPDTRYVFMPAGRRDSEIDIVENISDVAEQKRAIMLTHRSQRQDAKMLLAMDFILKTECFYLAD